MKRLIIAPVGLALVGGIIYSHAIPATQEETAEKVAALVFGG